MKNFKRTVRIACGLALGVTLAGAAQAATIVTAPMGSTNNDRYCTAVNTRATATTVTVASQDDAGAITHSKTVTLAPNQGTGLYVGTDSSVCKFTGPSKSSMAGMMIVVDPATGHYSAAISAQ